MLFSALLSVIRCISLFLIWLERLWKRIKVILRTTNIRFTFSSKNSLFSEKVWKRPYCLRNTREHLQFVLGVAIRSSCLLLSLACVCDTVWWLPWSGCWDPSPLSILTARMAGDGSASVGLLLLPCSLQPCVWLQEQLGHPCSKASCFVEAADTWADLALEKKLWKRNIFIFPQKNGDAKSPLKDFISSCSLGIWTHWGVPHPSWVCSCSCSLNPGSQVKVATWHICN